MNDENENLFNEYENNCKNFDDEIKLNFDQLKYLIDCFNSILGSEKCSSIKNGTSSINSSNSLSNSSSNSLDSTCLRAILINLNNLIDYYKNQKLIAKNLTFLQYLIIKRFNYLNNNLFNLNKKLVLRTENTFFDFNLNYNNFDKIELNILNEILNTNYVKLAINFQNSFMLGKFDIFSHSNSHFEFTVYQFEAKKKSSIIKIQKFKKSKRSLSAGARASKQKSISDENSSCEELESELINPYVEINEKCLKSDTFQANSDHTCYIDLNGNTNRIIIVLYNLYQDYKCAVLYEVYDINDKYELSIISSLNFTERKIQPNNSSMFRKIFKSKSKSKSRANSSQSKLQRALSNYELYPSSFFCLAVNFSNEFKNFTDSNSLINIERLDRWTKIWLPEISNCQLRYNGFKNEGQDFINISMSLITCSADVSQRRSKFDQHQFSKSSPKDEDIYYFLKIELNNSSEKGFVSSIFKLNELKLNDLYQIQVNEELKFKNLDLVIELYSFDLIKKEAILIENKTIALNWENFYYNRENLVLNFRNLFNLKFKILMIQTSGQRVHEDSIKILNFELNDQNELELYNIVKTGVRHDMCLIEKYLEFFSIIVINQKSNKKNLFRQKLLNRLYESFLEVVDTNAKLLLSFSFRFNQPKILQNWLLSNIKNLVELNQSKTLELTLKNFDFLIKLLVFLSQKSSSEFELKYNLNDLIMIKFIKHLKKEYLNEYLNMKFLDYLPQLFNGTELANMCLKLYAIETIKNQVININLFTENYQFRDRMCQIVLNDSIEFLKSVLKLKSKLSQNHLENIINVSFKPILDSLIENFKNEDLSQSIIDNFLVLVEMLELIMSSTRFNYFDSYGKDLINLFDVIECYFKYNQTILSHQSILCLEIDLILFKFFKYIQKYLLRFLINKTNLEYEVTLFKSYFNMLFSFLKEKNYGFYQYFYKVKLLESLSLFWKCLNIRLKNNVELGEFLALRGFECFFNNCFMKTIKLKIDLDEIEFGPINAIYSNQLVLNFNEILLKFLNQISVIHADVLFFNLIEIIVKHEKTKKLNIYDQIEYSVDHSSLKSQARQIMDKINPLKYFSVYVWNLISLAFDYHFLKDIYESESSVSVIESFLLIYTLLKKIETIDESVFHTTVKDSKRKIKLYLLDDFYYLNKSEKNHLLMSFIRKEQADLLQWEHESSLKEILYLKSLKKFAINSLQDKFLVQESPYLSEYYKAMTENKDGFLKSIQFEICKQLNSYYEKLDESCTKISRISTAENKFTQLMSNFSQNQNPETSKNHGHLYFRVGLFGKCLKFGSIQNKYYLYKHRTYEMLSNIQNLVRNKLVYFKWSENEDEHLMAINNVFLLHHNHEPENAIKESKEKCSIQICAVNKFDKIKFLELLEENLLDKENDSLNDIKNNLKNQNSNQNFYYFDRPFYAKNFEKLTGSIIDDLEDFERVKENESVENLWIERSVLVVDEFKYDNLSQFEEIKSIVKIYLNPIRNAITDINEKTKELKNFVVQFTANNSQNANINLIHSLQPLTMRLLGCLDARVNGGLIRYVRELLNENVYSNRKYVNNKKKLFTNLYSSIKSQLNVLESGLSIHDRILTNIEENLAEPSENLTEHIKHMNELNKHLIECLKIVQNELDDRWSEFF